MIKFLFSFIIFISIFLLPTCAQEVNSDDLYSAQYEKSGAEELENFLPEETKEFLNNNGFSADGQNIIENLNPKNVFSHIWFFIRSGAKTPLTSGTVILAIILISAAIGGINSKHPVSVATLYSTTLSAIASIVIPVFSALHAGINALKGCAVFITGFVPIFAVIMVSCGKVATSASMSTLFLAACQLVNFISNFVILPLMGGHLAISLSSGVSPIISNSGIADGIKKISYWTMSLLSTIFIGILSIQTVVTSSADSLSLRTTKFIVGSAVPIAGQALSEALSTVTASMGMLKASVGVYGVIACAVIFLPILAELAIWRIVLNITACISDLLSVPQTSSVLRSVDTMISVLIGIILLTSAMFIISLGIIISAGTPK